MTSITGTGVSGPINSATRRTVRPGGMRKSNASASALLSGSGSTKTGAVNALALATAVIGDPDLLCVPFTGARGGGGRKVSGLRREVAVDEEACAPACHGVGFHLAGTMNGSVQECPSLLSNKAEVTSSGLNRGKWSSAHECSLLTILAM
jgi:hypothetical protein